MAAIAILAGVHVSVIEAMDIQEVRNLVKKIKFIDKLPERELVPTTIDVNGRRYNVILRVDLLRGGQYIDLKTYTKNEDAFVDNMHNVISIFLQPLERRWFAWRPMKYDGAKQMEIANDLLNHMTIGEAYPMAVFFWTLLENLIDATHEYITTKALNEAKALNKQVSRRIKKPTTTTGVGL
jgi:hypothetical protein